MSDSSTKKLDKLPDAIDPDLDLEQIRTECKQLVKKRAYVAAGAAVIPIPFADLLVDTGILSQLIPYISVRFGLIEERLETFDIDSKEVHWKEVRKRAFEFAGMVMTRGAIRKSIQGVFGKIVTKQISKYIPFGGQVVSASLGYIVLSKVANDHIDECYRIAKKIQNDHKATLA